VTPTGREAYKGDPRKRRNEAEQGVGGGHITCEPRENRGEGRAATSIVRPMLEKAAGLPAREGSTPAQSSRAPSAGEIRQGPQTAEGAIPSGQATTGRRFTLLYDKVGRQDILQEAWQRVKSNKGAAGVDEVDIDEVREYGEARFLKEIEEELTTLATEPRWAAGFTSTNPDSRGKPGRRATNCYQMVGRVSHLPGLRRTPPTEDGGRAGCGQPARPVR